MNDKGHLNISNEMYFEEVQRFLDANKEVCIRVKGNSMLPFIKSGERVLLVSYRGSPLLIGSNILAKYDGKYIFHRFVGIRNGKIMLAGDGNLVLKEFVTESDILAIATLYYPNTSESAQRINARWPRLRGMIWYYLRMVRRIISGLKRRLST